MNFDIEELNEVKTTSNCFFNGSIRVFSFLWVRDTLTPQPNIRILLFREGCRKPIREGRTDRCGELTFQGLERGIYHVVAEVDERNYLSPIYKPSSRVRISSGDVIEEIAVINRLRERKPRPPHRCDNNIIDDNLLIIILLLFLCGCWW